MTEDANRKCTKLWEHYLAFEFEVRVGVNCLSGFGEGVARFQDPAQRKMSPGWPQHQQTVDFCVCLFTVWSFCPVPLLPPPQPQQQVGDLQTALRLEKRAREALGEAPGAPAGGGASARNIQLLLLRYQFNDSLPCAPGQRVYLEYLMGRGPAPPGFEKQQQPRSSRGSGGGREAAGAGGERDGDHGGDR